MTENSQDELARAYAMLSSLRKNIGEMTAYNVPETYVSEFHSVLDRLGNIGIDVSEFRIPDSEVAPEITSWNTLNGEATYSDEKYVERSFILTKLDAVLSYFEIITSEKPKKMGFSAPQD